MKINRKIMVAAMLSLFIGTSMASTEAATPTFTPTYWNWNYYYRMVQTQPKPAPAPTTNPAPAQTTNPTSAPTTIPTPAPAATPTPAPSADALTAQEQQMVNLVNQERTQQGLSPLQVDMRLVKMARMKSQDMITNNYFGHQSPTYGSPADMMKAQGIAYKAMGENIAGNSTVSAAHTSLMNSAGHRANILSSNFTKVGIGIVQGGPYGLMITQEFIG